MTRIGSLSVELGGDDSPFTAMFDAAEARIGGMEKQLGALSSIGNSVKKAVLPIASVLAGAFVSKEALSAFSESSLPGAKEYNQAIAATKSALTELSAAVGEYLAPAAKRAAEWTAAIANKLTPLVRQFTALTQSAVAFARVLAGNIATAFAPLLPTVAAAVESIKGMFGGPAHNWQKDIDAFRQWWNDTWSAALAYVAPIAVAAAGAFEAGLQLAKAAGEAAFGAIKAGAGAAADAIHGMFPPGDGAGFVQNMRNLADVAQGALVKGFVAAEFAMKNWQQALDVALAAGKFGLLALGDAVTHFAWEGSENGAVLWENLESGAAAFAANVKTIFQSMASYVELLFATLYSNIEAMIKNAVSNAAAKITNPFSDSKPPQWLTFPLPSPEGFAPKNLQSGDYKPLPGFSAPQESPETAAARKAMATIAGKWADDFGLFLGPRMQVIADAVKPFIDAITRGLPALNATPAAKTAADAGTERVAAVQQGTKEAYAAILKATSPKQDKADKQIDLARRELVELQQIKAGVLKKPPVAKF